MSRQPCADSKLAPILPLLSSSSCASQASFNSGNESFLSAVSFPFPPTTPTLTLAGGKGQTESVSSRISSCWGRWWAWCVFYPCSLLQDMELKIT